MGREQGDKGQFHRLVVDVDVDVVDQKSGRGPTAKAGPRLVRLFNETTLKRALGRNARVEWERGGSPWNMIQ